MNETPEPRALCWREPVSETAKRAAARLLAYVQLDPAYPERLTAYVRNRCAEAEGAGLAEAEAVAELEALKAGVAAAVKRANAVLLDVLDDLDLDSVVAELCKSERARRRAIETLEKALGEDGHGDDTPGRAAEKIVWIRHELEHWKARALAAEERLP